MDALSAAIEFQQAMAEANRDQPADTAIVFRIGLHLGDLIVDGDDLYGDGVNVAARLEGEAPAGGIVISGEHARRRGGPAEGELRGSRRPGAEEHRAAGPRLPRRVGCGRLDGASRTRTELSLSDHAPSPADAPLALPDKPSIAVLPFQNMTGDPEQEYFTDGITEDIITELSRFHSLFVIARNSSFSYKGKSPDVRQVGRELGVRYVLEGSIRKAANRVRVTGQLIDALTGSHIWAERYDRVLEDIFAVQEELTQASWPRSRRRSSTEQSKIDRRRPETSVLTKSPFGRGPMRRRDRTRRRSIAAIACRQGRVSIAGRRCRRRGQAGCRYAARDRR